MLDPRVLSLVRGRGAAVRDGGVREDRRPTARAGTSAVLKETGRLVLRETAQTPEDDLERFGDIDTWQYFNTNNLWVSLRALARGAGGATTACSGCR